MKLQNKKFSAGTKKEKEEEKVKIHPAVLGLLLFVVVGSAVFGLINIL